MLRPKEVVCKWVDAFNNHDVEAIVSLYHDNATNHQVTNEVDDPPKIAGRYTPDGLSTVDYVRSLRKD